MANLPIFAVGEYSKIEPAIASGKLRYPSYVFVSDSNKFAFVDKEHQLRFIVGDNKKQVLRVDALPEASNGDTEILYIFEDIVYVFTGTEFKPMYIDRTSEIEAIQSDVEILKSDVSGLSSTIEEHSSKLTELEETVSNLESESAGLQFIELSDEETTV